VKTIQKRKKWEIILGISKPRELVTLNYFDFVRAHVMLINFTFGPPFFRRTTGGMVVLVLSTN